jgi:ADP-ribose pyrophosphatase YjhB (NUDIX family)
MSQIKNLVYCSACGGQVRLEIPEGDDRERHVCVNCGKIHYQNPRIIVGCIPVLDKKVLLCRRGIRPRIDKWTIPAGFLEHNETVEEGALRETMEETRLSVTIRRLHTVYSLPTVGQVYLLFLARMDKSTAEVTPECREVGLFSEQEVPWDDIAFSSVRFALEKYFEDLRTGNEKPHMGFLYK